MKRCSDECSISPFFFSLQFHKFSLFSSFSWRSERSGVHCNSCHFLVEQPPPSLLQFVEVRTSLTVLSTFFYNLSSGGEGKGSSGKQVKNILSLFAHSKYESKNPLKWFVSVSKWQLIRSSNNLSPWVDSLDSVASFLQYCWLIELQIWKI